MLPISLRIKPPQEKTLGDENHHETSIRVNEQITSPPQLKLEKIAQDVFEGKRKDYSGRSSKERYPNARNSLPVGNFDWTQHKPRGTVKAQKEKKQWSYKKKLCLGLLLTSIAVGLVFIVIWVLHPKNTLHEGSVDPKIPTFIEMSGLINAPKLQPLVQANHQSRHLLKTE